VGSLPVSPPANTTNGEVNTSRMMSTLAIRLMTLPPSERTVTALRYPGPLRPGYRPRQSLVTSPALAILRLARRTLRAAP